MVAPPTTAAITPNRPGDAEFVSFTHFDLRTVVLCKYLPTDYPAFVGNRPWCAIQGVRFDHDAVLGIEPSSEASLTRTELM